MQKLFVTNRVKIKHPNFCVAVFHTYLFLYISFKHLILILIHRKKKPRSISSLLQTANHLFLFNGGKTRLCQGAVLFCIMQTDKLSFLNICFHIWKINFIGKDLSNKSHSFFYGFFLTCCVISKWSLIFSVFGYELHKLFVLINHLEIFDFFVL